MKRPQMLFAARHFAVPDYQWWALPAVLNHYHCPLADFATWGLVGKPPELLYHTLRGLTEQARPPKAKALAAGRHYWKHLSRQRRRRPLGHAGGQALVRAFGYDPAELLGLLDRERLLADFYQEGDQVKAIKRGAFGYNELNYEGEQELWSTVECGACGHEEYIREQVGAASATQFLDHYANQLDAFERISGPYCRCDQCDAISRVRITPAEDMCEDAWRYYGEDRSGEWEEYQEHLDELIGELVEHLEAHGLPKPDGLRLEVTHADWRGRDAWAECGLEGEALAEKLRVNSEFTISDGRLLLYPNGDAELRCGLSHHDVPTGSPVSVMPYWECELDNDEHLDSEGARESAYYVQVAEKLLCGRHTCFEYNPRGPSPSAPPFAMVSRDGLVTELEALLYRCGLDKPDDLTGYDLATALLLENVIAEIRGKTQPALAYVDKLREVLDDWLDGDEQPQRNHA